MDGCGRGPSFSEWVGTCGVLKGRKVVVEISVEMNEYGIMLRNVGQVDECVARHHCVTLRSLFLYL